MKQESKKQDLILLEDIRSDLFKNASGKFPIKVNIIIAEDTDKTVIAAVDFFCRSLLSTYPEKSINVFHTITCTFPNGECVAVDRNMIICDLIYVANEHRFITFNLHDIDAPKHTYH